MLGLLASAGCKSELYKDLSQREVNEMVALLDAHGIMAAKEAGSEGLYRLSVEEKDFARAVSLLKSRGLPRLVRPSLADLFQPSGLVPTPFEEHVRYLYGLSEELAHTVSLFDGVIDTRVHVVLPSEGDMLSGEGGSSGKASVYIKYDQSFDFTSFLPRIKKLISDSAEGITYNNVEVLAVPAYVHIPKPEDDDFWHLAAGIQIDKRYQTQFLLLVGGLVLLFIQPLLLALWLFHLYRRASAA